MEIDADAFKTRDRVALVHALRATNDTMSACRRLIESLWGMVLGTAFLIGAYCTQAWENPHGLPGLVAGEVRLKPTGCLGGVFRCLKSNLKSRCPWPLRCSGTSVNADCGYRPNRNETRGSGPRLFQHPQGLSNTSALIGQDARRDPVSFHGFTRNNGLDMPNMQVESTHRCCHERTSERH
jgi:hypothetical protein